MGLWDPMGAEAKPRAKARQRPGKGQALAWPWHQLQAGGCHGRRRVRREEMGSLEGDGFPWEQACDKALG